jgi:peptidoglycan/LPS O-acetylase OafA/YrhL
MSVEAVGQGAAAAMRPEASDKLRTDIQALRGLAILLVLLYHGGVPGSPEAGYLGVDIFFVVSGFLITGIIARGIQAGRFSFTQFYFRRAKRLLPAAYLTFFLTTVAALLILTQDQMRDYLKQLVGAVTFTGNVVLWRQTGYFEGAADLKPLLHVRSLSLEEQYYLLVPVTLFLVSQRFWSAGAWAVVAGSLALGIVAANVDPNAGFYLLPTRAWELGVGSLGLLALDAQAPRVRRVVEWLFWPSLAALVLVPYFPVGSTHPGWDAILVCFATLVVILRHHRPLAGTAPVRALSWVGDFSYSLYLIHWPLFALAACAWVSSVPVWVRVALLCLAILLGWLSYTCVENPVRHSKLQPNARTIGVTLLASLAVVLVGVAAYRWSFVGRADPGEVMAANVGFDRACESNARFENRPECRNSDAPEILVWGDSHAMQFVDGIAASTPSGVVQATMSACGPLLDVSYRANTGAHNAAWARNCIAFNDSVLRYLEETPSIRTVVLASVTSQYLDGTVVVRTTGSADHYQDEQGSPELATQALARTVSAIRSTGRRVIWLASMPMSDFDVGRCLQRRATGRPALGSDVAGSCDLAEARYRAIRGPVIDVLTQASRRSDLPVIWPDAFVCRKGRCASELDGTFLYRDKAHLTHIGSEKLGLAMNWGGEILARAR